MKKTFQLSVLTPFGKYLDAPVEYIQVSSEDYTLGILPGHSPLISTLKISTMYIQMFDKKIPFAIGGGILNVEKDKVTVLINSIERYDEIDFERAKRAKERAEDRLNKLADGEAIDESRARDALARALNRIKLIDSVNN